MHVIPEHTLSESVMQQSVPRSRYVGKRRWIGLLTLVLLGLITLIVITERQRFIHHAPVQLLPVEQANHIRIDLHEGDKNSSLELKKQTDKWQLVSPTAAAVNQDRIQPLLSLLTLPDSTAYPVTEVNLDELGLASPRATIAINQHTFTFGGPGPGEQQRYLMINGHVYLTRDILLPLVSGGAESLTTAVEE